jgi:hypothetical protein
MTQTLAQPCDEVAHSAAVTFKATNSPIRGGSDFAPELLTRSTNHEPLLSAILGPALGA